MMTVPVSILFFCCATLAGLCEILAASSLWRFAPVMSAQDWRLIGGTHATAALLMFVSAPKGKGWFHASRLWAKTDAILTLFLPPFGWAVAICLHAFFKPIPEMAEIKNEDDEAGFEVESVDVPLEGPELSRQELVAHHLDFVPLADILAGNDLNLKRGAVEKLAQLATPEAIAMLLARRGDPVPEVRFYATSALTRIKKDMDEELDAAKRQIQSSHEEGRSRLMLAKSYYRQIRSGLIDAATVEAYAAECDHHLKKASEFGDVAVEALFLLVETRRYRGAWDMAKGALETLTSFPGADAVAVAKKRVEIAYESADYPSVVAGLKSLSEAVTNDPAWSAALYLWGAA
jgi:hypothetical protein